MTSDSPRGAPSAAAPDLRSILRSRHSPAHRHWGLLRASAKGRRRAQLRRQLLEAGEHLLLIEILLSENKAREALAKFRAVKTRTPRALAAMRQIADKVARRHLRDAARLYAEIADASVWMDEPEVAVAPGGGALVAWGEIQEDILRTRVARFNAGGVAMWDLVSNSQKGPSDAALGPDELFYVLEGREVRPYLP